MEDCFRNGVAEPPEMIIYLKHDEIDRDRWDKCVANSPRVKPYGFSWYLDIMAPGWEALVDDDYDAVFPIPGFKRFGIKYIATPIFLQQLGVFSPYKPQTESINEFLTCMPDIYKLIDLCISQPVKHPEFTSTVRADYILDLSTDYNVLFKKFSRNCKRNIIASFENKPEIVEDLKPAELIRLFLSNKGGKIKEIKPRDYKRLESLMEFCLRNRKGKIIGVRRDSRTLIYGLFYIDINGNKTMILLANTPESYKKRTGYFVYNELIRGSAGSGALFDFAGSSIPSIAFFMESFGSKNIPYYRIFRNRLPWPLRYFKQNPI